MSSEINVGLFALFTLNMDMLHKPSLLANFQTLCVGFSVVSISYIYNFQTLYVSFSVVSILYMKLSNFMFG